MTQDSVRHMTKKPQWRWVIHWGCLHHLCCLPAARMLSIKVSLALPPAPGSLQQWCTGHTDRALCSGNYSSPIRSSQLAHRAFAQAILRSLLLVADLSQVPAVYKLPFSLLTLACSLLLAKALFVLSVACVHIVHVNIVFARSSLIVACSLLAQARSLLRTYLPVGRCYVPTFRLWFSQCCVHYYGARSGSPQ